jgi:AcrR family transcriptional regulator
MTEVGKRVYKSDLRAHQARATRRQIVTAASKLFAEHGYASATIDAVAKEAGVSRKTVFTSVGGKVELMKLAYDWAVTGDDEPVSMGKRPEIRELISEPDSARLLEKYAEMISKQIPRVAPLHAALRSSADVDPQARELFERVQDQRLAGMRQPAALLDERGVLREGMSRKRATDILWLYIDPLQWELLVQRRGWSRAAYADWLAASLKLHLLGIA